MTSIKIKNAKIVDPNNYEGIADVLIENNVIAKIDKNIKKKTDTEINAKGLFLVPGLVDMHTHLREPGEEYKETIESGINAAASGGFTTIACMPNTIPINDNAQITKYIIDTAKKYKKTFVLPIASISIGLKGKNLSEFGDLKKAGAIAFSDDGRPIENPQLMRRALEYAKSFDALIISHCEDLSLAGKGVMNESLLSSKMGLMGIPNISESIMVKRDVELCKLTKSRLHICHISTKESVDIIRNAKKEGVKVTSETAPHYFSLTENDVKNYNTNAKINPPLRSVKDKNAIIEGLVDGTIDAIATDHAPHSILEKEIEFEMAANGIIGLETSLPISYSLVEKKILSLSMLIEKMSKNPAKILNFDNSLKIGNRANLTVLDLDNKYKINSDKFFSKSSNTPFNNFEVKGKAICTIANGKIIHRDL